MPNFSYQLRKNCCLRLHKQSFSTLTEQQTLAQNRQVKIVEVGPRDGLQNEPGILPCGTKVEFIKKLALSGCPVVEVASFVSPSRVPAMANSSEVVSALSKWRGIPQSKVVDNITFSALTPNLRGLNDAVACGIDEVAVFGAASESFSIKNIQCSIDESLDRLVKVISMNVMCFYVLAKKDDFSTRFLEVTENARTLNIPVRGYVSKDLQYIVFFHGRSHFKILPDILCSWMPL